MPIEVTQLHCEILNWGNPTTETAPQDKDTTHPFRPKNSRVLRAKWVPRYVR